MDTQQMLILIGSILVPVFAGFGWMISHFDTKIDEVRNDLRLIDNRLSRLEGRFEERGYWESKKTGTESK